MAYGENLFATTRWNVVLEATEPGAPRGAAALDELCQTYWKPLYAYVRRCGYSPHDSEDLTQGFMARLLQNHALRTVAPVKGRFRSFLLASLKNHLANEWDRMQTQKRGRGQTLMDLNDPVVEQSYSPCSVKSRNVSGKSTLWRRRANASSISWNFCLARGADAPRPAPPGSWA
jgi:RNA polymerase sigma-70 factor (ECF subfamily)